MSNDSDSRWDPRRKPPPNVCPKQFCFFWLPKGSRIARGMHASLQDAIAHMQEVTEDRCGCDFGICTRLDPVNGDHDWYESCGPALRSAGLPWFYFIPSANELVEDLREQYLEESRALWGDDA